VEVQLIKCAFLDELTLTPDNPMMSLVVHLYSQTNNTVLLLVMGSNPARLRKAASRGPTGIAYHHHSVAVSTAFYYARHQP
jgi:hypothetical protein